MAVIVGSARSDENRRAYGGRAGDQTGREVSTQDWYLHAKGWRVFRAKSPDAAGRIARAMRAACDNRHVGYDQWQRNTLYTEAAKVGFDVSRVTADCETDCSALVRVCCAFAGILGLSSDFRTINEPSALMKTGAFVELAGAKYQSQSSYLGPGDILVTKTSGHTVVVLTKGAKYEGTVTPRAYELGERILKHGCEGADVKTMQEGLLALDYDLGKYGADGDFGDCTELAVKAFQKDHKLEVDGEFGPKSLAALEAALDALAPAAPVEGKYVIIEGGDCYIRTAPNTDGRKLGVAKKGEKLPFGGEISAGGWPLVTYAGENAWVSGKYGKVVNG